MSTIIDFDLHDFSFLRSPLPVFGFCTGSELFLKMLQISLHVRNQASFHVFKTFQIFVVCVDFHLSFHHVDRFTRRLNAPRFRKATVPSPVPSWPQYQLAYMVKSLATVFKHMPLDFLPLFSILSTPCVCGKVNPAFYFALHFVALAALLSSLQKFYRSAHCLSTHVSAAVSRVALV